MSLFYSHRDLLCITLDSNEKPLNPGDEIEFKIALPRTRGAFLRVPSGWNGWGVDDTLKDYKIFTFRVTETPTRNLNPGITFAIGTGSHHQGPDGGQPLMFGSYRIIRATGDNLDWLEPEAKPEDPEEPNRLDRIEARLDKLEKAQPPELDRPSILDRFVNALADGFEK